MAQANIVTIPDCYTCRGLTFLPQQCCGPVPAGEYDVLDEMLLDYTDLGRLKSGPAVPLVNIATGDKWYVGVQIAQFLLAEHKRPITQPA